MKTQRQLKDIGEFQLISKIQESLSSMAKAPRGFLGIGDDCAVLPGSPLQLISTDLLIEGVHFLRKEISPVDLGYKSLAVNLSDIAAMGGAPRYVFLSLSMPNDLELQWVQGFVKGLRSLAKQYHLILLGGDTSGSKGPISISVTILGEVAPSRLKIRSSAKPGDFIYVSGFLGDSKAGLEAMLKKKSTNSAREKKAIQKLISRHCRPRPHVEEGLWLSKFSQVHAMMDVSDGLVSDLPHILRQSHCGARIDLSKVPISPELQLISNSLNLKSWSTAFMGGEDYVLLFTVSKSAATSLEKKFLKKFQRPLYRIGEVTKTPLRLMFLKPGRTHYQPVPPELQGFHHF